jgi:predicted SnoaL-like aldol condensation-catalyzing enzyme
LADTNRSIGVLACATTHTHQTWPGNDEYVTMDFFRFDTDGKIVEHWDAMQEVPNETKNGNPMY